MTIKSPTLATNKAELGNGTEIAYYDSANGRSVPGEAAIVLLHGYCGSSAYWEAVVPMLQQAGRVIVPDLRGHGASSAPAGSVYSMEQFAEDAALLLDKLQLERVWLFGHSLGGYVTLAFAERYAERLHGYGLIHSTAWPDDEQAKQNRDKAAETIQTAGIQSFVDGLVPKLFAPEHLRSMPERVQHIVQVGYGTSAQGAAATARGMKERVDRRQVLNTAGLPVLLVAGGQDGVIAPHKTFAAEGDHITQALVEHCGHLSMVEAPEECSRHIAAFLDR
ncbi:alpha/beta fold hydrolase [Paenibacillus sp. GCM10027626]|uniref:alpha/beta fold hydrolase n=1 Tax=Paenibacillus sp. GCM10027626 TaxID=3273411 RepID=UPI003633A076